MDFMKDQEELYKTCGHFKDKAWKQCLWEQFAISHKLSVKVCKTWFDSQRTHYGKMDRTDGDNGMSDLDTGQVTMPEIAHQMQGA